MENYTVLAIYGFSSGTQRSIVCKINIVFRQLTTVFNWVENNTCLTDTFRPQNQKQITLIEYEKQQNLIFYGFHYGIDCVNIDDKFVWIYSWKPHQHVICSLDVDLQSGLFIDICICKRQDELIEPANKKNTNFSNTCYVFKFMAIYLWTH